ncbi:TonB-dependent receptor plug domain-containing protein [Epibacterium sp. SM1969]|uniref:TonB-dependent receptor plug domain-containing protein n=2 Tax=Tritonibacter aquimaris TaxID=2663379 RepID=A0A844B0T6_9RHOB|nr:TonB-dependent receptor plug domain-containing protein [Tritonibacter aquimaris]
MMGGPALNIRRGRSVGKTMLLAATALTAWAAPATADPSAALGTQIIDVSIEPQPLADALTQFGLQSGLQVSAASSVAADQYSPGVSGRMPAREALRQLISGASVPFQFLDEDTAVLNLTDDSSGPLLLEKIIVRGELLERNLQDSPTSVVISSGETVEKRGDRNIYDTVERAANVIQTGGEERVAIRGVGQFGVGRGSSSPLISTQVDGIALPDLSAIQRGSIPVWDVEQVEILRGPQSTQQGRNALGGAVIVRTRDPIYEDEYRARLGFGNRNAYETAVSINKVLVQDRAAFRFSAQTLNDDGWVDNPTLGRDDFGRNEVDNYRAKLRLNPTDDLELVFSYANQDSLNGETRIENARFPAEIVNTSNEDTVNELSSETIGLRASYSFSPNLKLEAETTYYTDDLNELIDNDRAAADIGFTRGSGEAEVFEQDLRLKFEGSGFRGVAGVFYNDTDFERRSLTRIPIGAVPGLPSGLPVPPSLIVVSDGGTRTQSENFAIFGEVEMDLRHNLALTLGARYDREKVTVNPDTNISTDPVIPLPPGILPAPSNTTFEAEFDAFLPKIGLTYDWSDAVSTSLTYQRGYRAGGASRNFFTGTSSEFDPEFTDNLELAFRGSFMDGRILTNANLFYTRWKDQQVETQLSSALNDTQIVNAGRSELYGTEISVEYEATPSLVLFGNVGYLHAEFEDFPFNGDNLRGNRLPNAPEITAAVGAEYAFANGVSLGVDATYTGSSFTDAENTRQTDKALLVNAQINYERGPMSAGLFVRNLLEEDYATTRLLNNGTSTILAKAGEPLTVGAFIQYSF